MGSKKSVPTGEPYIVDYTLPYREGVAFRWSLKPLGHGQYDVATGHGYKITLIIDALSLTDHIKELGVKHIISMYVMEGFEVEHVGNYFVFEPLSL